MGNCKSAWTCAASGLANFSGTILLAPMRLTDITLGSTALYQRVGDLNAFQLVQRHLDWLREATVWGTVGRWRGRSATR